MRLYAGSSVNFMEMNRRKQIAPLLEEEFLRHLDRRPSPFRFHMLIKGALSILWIRKLRIISELG
jgi:hypothetical protein